MLAAYGARRASLTRVIPTTQLLRHGPIAGELVGRGVQAARGGNLRFRGLRGGALTPSRDPPRLRRAPHPPRPARGPGK
eukprot:6906503-Pyramimonas_sp.AAC.2